eukprot:scaffold11726_cov112-Cylindrotheca_fusiformis.AAC.2
MGQPRVIYLSEMGNCPARHWREHQWVQWPAHHLQEPYAQHSLISQKSLPCFRFKKALAKRVEVT